MYRHLNEKFGLWFSGAKYIQYTLLFIPSIHSQFLINTIILSNLYGRISRVVKAKYCTSAVGTSVMCCLDDE